MSDKLTKAQQAAEPKKRKKMTVEEDAPKELSTQRSVAAIKKEMAAKKGPGLRGDAAFPLRYAIAVLCAVVLLVFVSVLLSDEGVVLQVVVNVFCGLFGRNVYYISMFALCYLICIQLLSKGKPVRGRSGSIVAFVFLFGCVSHLIGAAAPAKEGLAHVGELYQTGMLGVSGGVMSNTQLREYLSARFGGRFAPPMYSADNAAGIACLCRIAYEESVR